jgi:hypothetical protein
VQIEPYNGDVKSLLDRLNGIGFERTRRAVAALALSLFVFLYLLIGMNPPAEEWRWAFLAMSACYGVAFMGVAAEWFWGRWFAAGLGYSGVMVAVAAFAQIGWAPVLAIYGALHGLVVLVLSGRTMAERFDLQPAWRERYGMDEYGVARLRKTVTRASASLPSVILYMLAPKEPGQSLALCLLAGALALVGLRGTLRLRSWGVLALGAAAAAFIGLDALSAFPHASMYVSAGALRHDHLGFSALLASRLDLTHVLAPALLAAAVLPFARPTLRFLARR